MQKFRNAVLAFCITSVICGFVWYEEGSGNYPPLPAVATTGATETTAVTTITTATTTTTTTTTTATTTPETTTTTEPIVTEVFKLTHYCACEKCCGVWAYNRPKDEQGRAIVEGCGGKELIPGYSVAADLDVYPLGTSFYGSDGRVLYEVMDTGGAIRGNHLDVYCGTHEEALQGGLVEGVELRLE
jgi:3D (Asp-Asp-Asp) domain-containing protein